MKVRIILISILAALAALGAGCAKSGEKASGNTLELSVTEKGFEPATATVSKGEQVRLVITRKTDRTCATEIVIDEYDIHADLPLNQPVTVTFTPRESGELVFGCGMNKMIRGVLTVR